MKQTIITTMLALVVMTSWAQKFTISGDLSVMTNKFDLPPAKANIVYIWNDSLKGTPIEYAVKDGKFEISGNVSRPIYSKLMVQLEIEVEGRKDTTTEGSDAYKKYVAEWLADEETVCVTNDDFTRLQELFHFSGIPHYETITPDCRRVRDDLRLQGLWNFDNELKKLIERLK